MLKKIIILFSILLPFIFCLFIFFKGEDALEINISYIDFYVKNKISKIFEGSDVNAENTSVIWQKDAKDPYLIVTDLVIINPDFTIKIPKLFVHFKLSSLFKANTNFSQVLADNIHVYTRPTTIIPGRDQQKEEVWITSSQATQMTSAYIREFFFGLNAGSKIEFTNIAINKGTEGEFFVDKLYIGKREDSNVLDINIQTKDKKRLLDDLSITIKNRNNLLNIYGTFYDLKLGLFSELSTLVKSYNLDENIGFKGNFSLKINEKNEIIDGNIYVLNTESKDLIPNSVNINLIYSNKIISVKNFHFKLKDTYLSLIGKMNFNTNHALMRVNISKIAAKDLCVYVPGGVVNDEFKSWYCDNIDGNILNTIISFNGKINNLIDDDLSDVIIVADIENGSVKFDEDFEQVKELNGELILKNNNLKIAVNSAKFQNFTINNSDIEMNSLNKENSVLTINGKAVSDAYALYEPIKFKLDDVITTERDKVSGMAKSVFNFRIFNLNADDKKVDFSADFHSEIDDLTIYNASLGEYDIKLNFGSDFIDLNGSGMVNNTQLLFDLKSSNKNERFAWNLIGDLPSKIFNLDEGISGYVNANIESVINQDRTGHINGNIDLSELESHSSYLGWKNHFEDHNKVAFAVKLKGKDKLSLDQLDVTGSDLDIKLSGKAENGNLYLNSSNFQLPDNDFSIEVKSDKEKNTITIHGEKINLSDILDLLTKSNGRSSGDIEVDVKVDNVIMKEGIIIKDAKLNITCIKGDCNGSQFTGQFLEDKSNILAEYSGIGLEIYSDNSGMLLRSFGISKSFKNGKLSFYLSPQRKGKEHYGMLSISNFYIKDAPLLTTLLSMSSLPGIVNAIKNEGVYFYKCNAPFSYKDGTIKIEESWLEGAELGISTRGTLDIKGYKFQVEGQVIPAYSINKSLLRIPIIGKLLTGGKSRGIVSIDYKASGDDKNSSVFVDFISSLTPSLLKRVLGVFDRIMTKTNKTIASYIPG
ncbi:YhdP family protein [Wolbachia endosymbiont of Folsomia candida]|uniref:YhdP family protein n=1 Tax=Wolbachia endosymbiont of Folsomia candida TaxID=169402 RepID=UPI000AA55BB3|nr:AsmA-like C-terminal domain-containing protein [Wolbachia endosymbiont of Folsomia candida]APR97737.1 hypothetical protein ASM33_00030 [Wolbachia endosymbiont of Folsomia candida]